MSFNETTLDGKYSNQMCFQANLAHYPYDAEQSVKLEYSICTGNDVKQLHTYSSKVVSDHIFDLFFSIIFEQSFFHFLVVSIVTGFRFEEIA